METNERMKKAVRAAIQEAWERFFAQVQELSEGDVEHREEQVVTTSQQMGRNVLEGMRDRRLREQRPAARRQGRCGHRQRVGGERPTHLLRLVGPVTFVRPSDHCLGVPEADASWTHGEAHDDALWGVQQQRTTSGVQRKSSSVCGRLTCEEAAETVCRHVSRVMSARQALTVMRPAGEALIDASRRSAGTERADPGTAGQEPPTAEAPAQGDQATLHRNGWGAGAAEAWQCANGTRGPAPHR